MLIISNKGVQLCVCHIDFFLLGSKFGMVLFLLHLSSYNIEILHTQQPLLKARILREAYNCLQVRHVNKGNVETGSCWFTFVSFALVL
jgi:hypothetical protein